MSAAFSPDPGAGSPVPTARTSLHREAQRGAHDRATIDAIIDEALVCHLGFVAEGGYPVVVPTIHARCGDTLYLHGSAAGRTMRHLTGGVDVCCTITMLDGLVVARSGFWSSMNYRSVMVFGRARLVSEPAERLAALDAIVDHVLPGRSVEVRRPTGRELGATKVAALSLDEASAKVRSGDPLDDPADVEGPAWAGTVPLHLHAAVPVPAANLDVDIDLPASVTAAASRGQSPT